METNLSDIIDRDAFKFTQASVFFTERYNEMATSWWGFPLLLSLVLLLTVLMVLAVRGTLGNMLHVWGLRREARRTGKAMMKLRRATQREAVKEHLISMFEDKVEAGEWSRVDANYWYNEYRGKYPDFKNCIEKVEGNALIKAELTTARGPDGIIKPMPFPKEGPTSNLSIVHVL